MLFVPFLRVGSWGAELEDDTVLGFLDLAERFEEEVNY
jgi:hypothetical protein